MKSSKKLRLDAIQINSFITNVKSARIFGGDGEGGTETEDEIDSGHAICTLDSCIGSTECY